MRIYVTIEVPKINDCNSPEADMVIDEVTIALKNAGIGYEWWIDDADEILTEK